jgi:hypothetical protein
MPDIEVHLGRGRGRRGISGLGLLLVVVGAVALAVSWSILPAKVYQMWPLILVAVGVVGVIRRPGWIDELDFAVPGAGEAAHRPRRAFSWFLIGVGLLLLMFTLHLVDQRVIGPVLLIALGAFLIWRRTR